MFIKKIGVVAASVFLLAACSANEEKDAKLTLSEMEAQASMGADSNDAFVEETVQVTEPIKEEPAQSVQDEQEENPVKHTATNGENVITWNEFFDNEKQDTPSNKFWDLKGEEVVIDGFMGEVLSFGGGWFLLIPEPGAECPFDNGDESYWNKIMIIFVKDKKDLRFTSGPLRVTGRLDVGVKVDESNYRTMFRLYDASFERIK